MLTLARRTASLAMVVYCAALAFLLLNPSAEVPTSSVSRVAEWGDRLGLPALLTSATRVEFGLNVLMLVPLSVLGSFLMARSTWRDWVAYGFVFSCSVELTQGLFFPHRSATFSDVVANTLGAGIGAVLVMWGHLQRPPTTP